MTRDANAYDNAEASDGAAIRQPVCYPQADLFLSRSRQADLAGVQHWNAVVSDVSVTRLRRDDIERLVAAGNELAGRLMLRTEGAPS